MLPGVIPTVVSGQKDPFFSNVALLLHGDGANGSTTFTDSSGNNFPVTVAGNAQISTSQSKFGGASMAFDGTGDYAFSSTTFAAWGTSDVTIESWVYFNVVSASNQNLWDFRQAGGDTEPIILLNAQKFLLYMASGNRAVSVANAVANTWYHLALTKASNVWRLFVNGTQVGSNYTNSTSLSRRNLTLAAGFDGRNTASTDKFNGYIDDFRMTIGVARYTANFTPPTRPFPNY